MSLKEGITKVIKQFSQTEKEKQKQELLDFIQQYRENNIDDGYNPIHGLDQLTNDDVDYILSISNRGDGKTFGYLGCLVAIAYHFDLPLMLLQRHWTLREGAIDELIEVVTEREALPEFDKYYIIDKQREYTCVYYKDKLIAIACELDNSSDLKRKSFFIRKARIIVYDEFITLPCDYVPQEAVQYTRIFKSVHRGFQSGELPYIGNIKVVCLGNPENLASPVLHMLKVTRQVQQQPINTEKIFRNVYVEKFENEKVNAKVNLRAIPEGDTSSKGDFQYNLHNIPNDDEMNAMLSQLHDSLWIKLTEGYLEVQYSLPHQDKILIRYMNYNDTYDFCTNVHDYNGLATYIDNHLYNDDFYRHHLNDEFYYNDEYSRGVVLKDENLKNLNLYTLIAMHHEEHHDPENDEYYIELQRKNYQERDIYQESKEFCEQWMGAVFYGKV